MSDDGVSRHGVCVPVWYSRPMTSAVHGRSGSRPIPLRMLTSCIRFHDWVPSA